MEYRLGICDEDYHYVVNLMEYVNSHRALGVSLVAFSSISAVEEYLDKAFLDGVLIGQEIGEMEKALDGFKDRHSGLILIPLVGDRKPDSGGIFKYQNARLIVQGILERLNVDLRPVSVDGKSFYAVYSPLGRCGKTSLAKGLGVNHKGALYIGLEEFSDRNNLGEEILYHIIFENSKLHQLLGEIKPNQHGLWEVKGILSYMDIRHLKKENVEWLKGQLLVGGDYDRVIFDIGAAVLSDLNILNAMDRIYVPVLDDEESRVKLQAFRELLRCKEYSQLGNKLQYLSVPICHYASEVMRDFILGGEL